MMIQVVVVQMHTLGQSTDPGKALKAGQSQDAHTGVLASGA
jgi:hypothetical protein